MLNTGTNFSTGLNTGFGSGINVFGTKPKEKERFPGLDPEDIKRIEDMTKDVPENQKQEVQSELYRQVLPIVEQRKQKAERIDMTNQLSYETVKENDNEKKTMMQGNIRISDLATKVKDKFGVPMGANDNEVLGRFIEQTPNGLQLFTDYLNGKSEELLYVSGLKEKPIKLSDTKGKNPLVRGAGGLLGGAWGTVKGLYEGLIPGFGEMVDNTKKILDDPNKSSDDKFAQIVIGEGIGGYLGGIIGHTFGGTLEGLYKGFTSESEREFVDQNVKNVMESIVESKPGQYIMDQYNKLDENDKEELNDMLRYTMGYVDIATLMIGGPVATKAGKTGIEGAVKATEKVATSKAGELIGGTAKAISKTPKPSEVIAKAVTKTASPQDKLFKAQNPSLNVLNKRKDIKAVRAQSDTANRLIVEAGHKPVDTETRRIAHELTMTERWKDVEKAIGKKKDLKVDQNHFSDILDDFIVDIEGAGLEVNKSDIAALKAESQAMRKQGSIDLATLEKKKQLINGVINNRGDAKVGDVYQNGMKQVTRAIGEAEDRLLSKIPGEFQALKDNFAALKSTYEDVLKADIKNQRNKGIGLVQSYSRIEGVADILGGSLSVLTRGGEGLKDVAKGAGKLLMGKSLKKATDPDFLIKEGFEGLVNKLKAPKIKAPIAPANSKATIKSPTAVKETAKKTVNESIPQLKATVKAPIEVKKELVALHNLSETKLEKVVDLGGMPMPSVAITEKGIPFNDFGDITLVGKKSLVDPSLSKKTKLYGADAYTPRVPGETLVQNKNTTKVLTNLAKKADDYGIHAGSIWRDIDDGTNNVLPMVFAKEKGIPFKAVKVDGKIDVYETLRNVRNEIAYSDKYKKEYAKFVKELKNEVADKKLFKGFTDSGRKYQDYTLDNVLKEMKTLGKGEESSIFAGSYNQMIGKSSKSIKSIGEAKTIKFSDKTEALTKKYDKLTESYENMLSELSDKYDKDFSSYAQNLSDGYSKNLTNRKAKMDEWGTPISIDELKKVESVIEEGTKLPKSYIEAKPERAVGLNEFEYVLVPEKDIKSVSEILKDTPLKDKIVGYKGEGGRTSKLAELQKQYGNVFFSVGGVLFPFAYLLSIE